ncbi:MAG TPA: GatB/YqeY domain-containing protein [Blastocatellia bacterium]|nr:GatB/YqeY domain-containing protein [Blastocatellia bacterium]
MSLGDQIVADLNEAMKARDAVRTGTLRMVRAALLNTKIDAGHDLNDDEVKSVLASLIKQRKDSVEQYILGGRMDLAGKELAEIKIIETYLPPPLTDEDLGRIVAETISETGAASIKDMGKVMKAVMVKLSGQAVDGKVISELVRGKLS